jgi:hypothetical protein
MTYEDALLQIANLEKSFPKGHKGASARVGWALHSETLAPMSIWSTGARVWEVRDEDTQILDEWTHWGNLAPEIPSDTLTGVAFSNFTGHLVKHKKGNLYLCLAPALLNGTKMGVYVHIQEGQPSGPWWVRPWDMMTDGRFETVSAGHLWPYE